MRRKVLGAPSVPASTDAVVMAKRHETPLVVF